MMSQAVANQLRQYPQFNPMLSAQGPDLISQAITAAHQRLAQSPYAQNAAMLLPLLMEAGEGAVPEEAPAGRPTQPLIPPERQAGAMGVLPPYGPVTRPYAWPPTAPEQGYALRGYGAKVPDTEPLTEHMFGSKTSRLRPQTTPLPSVGNVEERYHGTPDPLTILGDPLQHSWHGNLHGPGLYTTDDYTVASGYGEGGSGVVYRVYQIRPVKFLDTEAPIPRKVFSDLVGKNPEWGREFMTGPYSKSPSWQYVKDRIHQIHNREALWSAGEARAKAPFYSDPNARMLELVSQLKKEGYGGLMHEGGLITRGPSHQVKIYWDPENQVQMRQVSAQAQTSELGQVPPPLPERVSRAAKRHLKEMEQRRDDMIRKGGGLKRYYTSYF